MEETKLQPLEFWPTIEQLQSLLKHVGYSDFSFKALANAVQWLSDIYISKKSCETPWDDPKCLMAYLSYYHWLNAARVNKMIRHARECNFFSETTHLVDLGSGFGTAGELVAERFPKISSVLFIEKSTAAIRTHQKMVNVKDKGRFVRQWSQKWSHFDQAKPKNNTTLLMSYSMNEMGFPFDELDRFESIVVLEPSTQRQGRELSELRKKLLECGFYAWAPCVHQQSCPLLEHSKTDWCHDRVNLSDRPGWMKEIEAYLPFKNETVTYSYLMMSRSPRVWLNTPTKQPARLVGDSLSEKGKVRQLICRGSDREFWAQLTGPLKQKGQNPLILPRGELVEIQGPLEKVSNELRSPVNLAQHV